MREEERVTEVHIIWDFVKSMNTKVFSRLFIGYKKLMILIFDQV